MAGRIAFEDLIHSIGSWILSLLVEGRGESFSKVSGWINGRMFGNGRVVAIGRPAFLATAPNHFTILPAQHPLVHLPNPPPHKLAFSAIDQPHDASITVRKGMCESQCQIDLNYGFTHSSSERGMKPVCVNFIQFQTFAKTILKNRKYTFMKLLGCGACNPNYVQYIFEARGGIRCY